MRLAQTGFLLLMSIVLIDKVQADNAACPEGAKQESETKMVDGLQATFLSCMKNGLLHGPKVKLANGKKLWIEHYWEGQLHGWSADYKDGVPTSETYSIMGRDASKAEFEAFEKGPKPDLSKCKQANMDACIAEGDRFIGSSPQGARAAYLVACDKGSSIACRKVGLIEVKGSSTQIGYFDKGCTGNDGESCFLLGQLNLKNDEVRAEELFDKACKSGYHAACDEAKKIVAERPSPGFKPWTDPKREVIVRGKLIGKSLYNPPQTDALVKDLSPYFLKIDNGVLYIVHLPKPEFDRFLSTGLVKVQCRIIAIETFPTIKGKSVGGLTIKATTPQALHCDYMSLLL